MGAPVAPANPSSSYRPSSGTRPGLQGAFERVFNRRVNFWDPTENLDFRSERIDSDELKDRGSQLVVAMGLASRILD